MSESIREATERLVRAVEVWCMARASWTDAGYPAVVSADRPLAVLNAEHALQSAWADLKALARKEDRHGRRSTQG